MTAVKILFVTYSLGAGGAERALINLLSTIDSDRFDVDLQLLQQKGLYLDVIPDHVNLLPPIPEYEAMSGSFGKLVKKAFKLRKPQMIASRALMSARIRINRAKEGYMYQIRSRAETRYLPTPEKEYDVAVGYLHGTPSYYVIDKVKAKKKILWWHNDFEASMYRREDEYPYLEKADAAAVVSEENRASLCKVFPEFADKIHTVYNIISKKAIQRLAEEYSPEEYGDGIKILTVGRLHPQKGYELSIDACAILKSKGYDIKWYVIGEGELRQQLQERIDSNGLTDDFKLLGLRANPYPYYKNADIYVQSSRYEGYGIAIQEARLLCCPSVVTNFTVACDQITDGVNGLISDISANDLAVRIAELIDDKELYNSIKDRLADSEDTTSSLEKHYELFTV